MYPTESGAVPAVPAVPAAPAKSRAPLVIGIVAAVLLLCCGGGVAVYLLSDKSTDAPGANASPEPTGEEVEGNLEQFKTGDCLTISGSAKVKKAKCTDAGAYRVLLRKDGTMDEAACDGTDYTQVLTSDAPGTAKDLILCIKPEA